MGEEIIIQDENGKKYSVLRVLNADTKKIIDDLSALVVKKDKLIKQLCIGIREHDSLEDSICPLTEPLDCHDINKDGTCIDCIIKYYEERCK